MMQKINKYIAIMFIVMFTASCSPVEISKSVWGSSIRRLDIERANAIRHTYSCSFDNCFDEVLSLERQKDKLDKDMPETEMGIVNPDLKGTFEVFLKDRNRGVIVVMKVPGNVDTTEVGIFFSRVRAQETTIEVTSLSTSAKRKVAEFIDDHLTRK